MPTERIACRTEGCKYTILPTTASATGGYCMPCIQKQLQEAQAEFVRQNRHHVDPYAGISNPIEIIRIFHTSRPYDPLKIFLPPPRSIDEFYSTLSSEQAHSLINVAIDAMVRG